MTPLEQLLLDRIAADGPINIADYMSQCLMHPEHGYYTQQTVFGSAGDFVTAPGVSQMFGEMVGLSLAQSWITQGKPQNAILVELGPGDGTLMADILRVAKAVPGFGDLPVHMVETSAKMRTLQQAKIGKVTHHDDVTQLPDHPIFVVANEFFDALPIRQFKRAQGGWQECFVGAPDGELQFGVGPVTSLQGLAHRLEDTKNDDIVEQCPALPGIVTALANRISKNAGAAIFVDYGDWRSMGNTLQGVGAHKAVHTLAAPGKHDMTAHVDFEAIAQSAAPVIASKMTTQGVFLERLGIIQRAQILAKSLSGVALENHITAHRRLTHPDEMGTLFKVIGLAPKAEMLPAGLDP